MFQKVSQRSRRTRDNLNFPGDRSFVGGYSSRKTIEIKSHAKSLSTLSRSGRVSSNEDRIRANWSLPDFRLDGYDRGTNVEQKVRDKGWKVVNNGPSNRVVVRLKFRETPERFYVCSTYYSIL